MRLPSLPTILAGVLVLAAGIPVLHAAAPDESLLNRVVELNKRALARYEVLDMEGAAALLREAVDACNHGNLDHHAAAARTHLHLGVVYVGGLKHRELGLAEFRKALAIDPDIRPSQSLSNPEVEAAFAEARTATPLQSASGRTLPFPTGQESRSTSGELVGDVIVHPPVTLAVREEPLTIKVQVPPGLGAAKAVLAYRAEHGDEFLARDMVPVAEAMSWYRAEIPAAATQGNWVLYYIEARRDDDEVLAQSGTPEAPHRVTLAGRPSDEEGRAVKNREKARKTAEPRPGFWMLLAMGAGGGYHRGSPEMNPHDTAVPPNDLRVSGFGVARTVHLAPELGYFQSDRFVLSAQGRFQILGGTQDVTIVEQGQHHTYKPARMALAGFLKATWLVHEVGSLQPLIFAQLGAGQIRHSVETPAGTDLPGCGGDGRCRDTVLGGLLLAGGGVGATYALVEHVGLYGALTLLAGAPHTLLEADLNVGLALRY